MCHDAFYNNGSISIVLEYVDAGSLADIMEELEPKCFPEPNLAVVCKQVLQGLVYIQENSAHNSRRYQTFKPP